MLVASNLPPRPVSITATSTFFSKKYLKHIAVVSSKKVGLPMFLKIFSLFVISSKKLLSLATSESLIVSSPTIILSLKLSRWGEVYKPVFKPCSFKI
jgi:hypothetical protein